MEYGPREQVDAPSDSDTGNPTNAFTSGKAAKFLEKLNDAFGTGSIEDSGEATVDLGPQSEPGPNSGLNAD